MKSADLCVEVCPVQAIIPGCKGVLNIGAERAADLRYTPGQQVRVKDIKDDRIFVGFDGFVAQEAWVTAGEVSTTQAETQPVLKVELGEVEKCRFVRGSLSSPGNNSRMQGRPEYRR